jgi:hypothetical protein
MESPLQERGVITWLSFSKGTATAVILCCSVALVQALFLEYHCIVSYQTCTLDSYYNRLPTISLSNTIHFIGEDASLDGKYHGHSQKRKKDFEGEVVWSSFSILFFIIGRRKSLLMIYGMKILWACRDSKFCCINCPCKWFRFWFVSVRCHINTNA